MAYTFRGWSGNFTGWGDESTPPGMQVVLLPRDFSFRSKADKMLYVLNILGRDLAPRNHLGHREASLEATIAELLAPGRHEEMFA